MKICKPRLAKDMSQGELVAIVPVEKLMPKRCNISRTKPGTMIVAVYELLVLARILRISLEEPLEIPKQE